MQRHCAFAALLLIFVAGSAVAKAGTLAGYTQHVWQAADGLPEQTVQAFAQTADGYLWIGTTGGLVRFDGTHFTVFDRQNTPSLHENNVFCLMVSRDGALWIGTEGAGSPGMPRVNSNPGLGAKGLATILSDRLPRTLRASCGPARTMACYGSTGTTLCA